MNPSNVVDAENEPLFGGDVGVRGGCAGRKVFVTCCRRDGGRTRAGEVYEER